MRLLQSANTSPLPFLIVYLFCSLCYPSLHFSFYLFLLRSSLLLMHLFFQFFWAKIEAGNQLSVHWTKPKEAQNTNETDFNPIADWNWKVSRDNKPSAILRQIAIFWPIFNENQQKVYHLLTDFSRKIDNNSAILFEIIFKEQFIVCFNLKTIRGCLPCFQKDRRQK